MTRIEYNDGKPVPRHQNHLYPVHRMAFGDYFIAWPRPRQSIEGLRAAITVAVNAVSFLEARFCITVECRDASRKRKPLALRCTCFPEDYRKTDGLGPVKPRIPRCKCPKCKKTFECPACAKAACAKAACAKAACAKAACAKAPR